MTGISRATRPQRIFLTGEPGSGKTTVVKRAAELLAAGGFKVGGMMSKEIRESGSRTGFGIEDFITHEEGMLAKVGSSEGPQVGKYTVNLHDLDDLGARAIQRAIEAADVILVDELGPMELHSHRFIESVEAALSSQKHVLGTIHKRATHPLVMTVKSKPEYTILEVTPKNRAELPAQIFERITRRK
jgi:nucleoside-triphosphatase